MSKKADTIWVDVEILVVRETSVLVKSMDDGAECWLPRAAIIDSDKGVEPGVENRLELRTELAEEKGLA
jgi:hypothetical protein